MTVSPMSPGSMVTPARIGWSPGTGHVVLAHRKYGAIVHCVVQGQADPRAGTAYDLPVFLEPGGAIVVPECSDDGAVVLVTIRRPVVSVPGEYPGPVQYPSARTGWDSLELPRGFSEPGETGPEGAARELSEELGVIADPSSFRLLGHSNCNTTFFASSPKVYLVRVSRADARPAVGHEGICRVEFLSPDELFRAVAEDRIVCGMTKSALLMYFAYRRTHERDRVLDRTAR